MEKYKEFLNLCYKTLQVSGFLLGGLWLVLIAFPTSIPRYKFQIDTKNFIFYKMDEITGDLYIMAPPNYKTGWYKLPNNVINSPIEIPTK